MPSLSRTLQGTYLAIPLALATDAHAFVDTSWEPIIDYLDPDVIYASTSLGGVFLTEDAGVTWTPLNTGLFHKNVTAIKVDAVDHRTVYAGTEGGGIFRNVRP